MKINRNSWHYKWSNFFTNQEAYNASLCSYFWKLVFSLIVPPGIILLLITFVGYAIFKMFTEMGCFNLAMVMYCVLGMIFLPGLALSWYRDKNKYTTPLLPGEEIVIAFIKAKKRKICPLIKFYYK